MSFSELCAGEFINDRDPGAIMMTSVLFPPKWITHHATFSFSQYWAPNKVHYLGQHAGAVLTTTLFRNPNDNAIYFVPILT